MRSLAQLISIVKERSNSLLIQLARLVLDRPERRLIDSISVPNPEYKIPNTVYQTWETDIFGKRHHKSITKFRQQNPDFSFLLFDSTARDHYMEENWSQKVILQVYRDSVFGAMKADIFRYCILFEKGGYYFDISKGLKAPILSMIRPDNEFFVTQESTPLDDDSMDMSKYGLEKRKFLQWGLGFVPQHPILAGVIQDIEDRYESHYGKVFDDPKTAILNFTGPGAFTRAMYLFLDGNPEASRKVLGVDFFGQEVFALKGSGYRFASFPSYSEIRNSPILVKKETTA